MKLISIIIAYSSFALALPSSTITNDTAPSSSRNLTRPAIPSCEPGREYCYEQIVKDLAVPNQTILHQYCDEQYKYDALSCHGCKKVPWPMDECWDGPGAWNSVFTCKSGQEYGFATRCNWCEAGKCV
ncbi:hypothetical protein IQ06DRAFT_267102 [Phaeosphaeriaceae sp. SRC1lsM3a]|nr:hypothetical protein IQ06DRAFT_267102 [Stagonospora sp. SRC1lsM3a]